MKELINIVNSKIQAVVDELKAQKQLLEQKLKTVDTDIEKKVEAAANCKNSVEEASNAISLLEDDINKLKTDLQELHDKFDSAGFKELIEAGNKEINGKIIENNTKIAEKQELIRRYSEEAQSIKDELTVLRDNKVNLETDLNNTKVALKYYSKKIDDMTITAIEHAEKLSDIVLIDDDNNELSDVDVNKVIDGTIFDEIDHISSGDKNLSEQEIEDILNDKEDKLSQTQALDAAIVEAEEEKEVLPIPDASNLNQTTIANEEPIVQTENIIPTTEVESTDKVEPPTEVKEEVITNNISEEIEKIANDSFQPTLNPFNVPQENEEVVDINISSDTNTTQVEELQPVVNNVQDIKSTFASINNEGSSDKFKELNLDPSKFDNADFMILNNSLDVAKGAKIIDVLEKHFIDTDNIYSNPEILITMAPEVLDEELDLLERAGCIASTIGYIFNYLDKIDINKLRETVTGPTDSVIKVIYDCISEKESTNIAEVLGLSPEEAKVLEGNLDAREYNIFCTFPEIIKANHDTIKNLHVENPNKCISEHPKRYMNNPDVFDDILDKYDTPDLVRCINKNPAVIDKL